MKARPILFSAPMVRALLDGRKTQTRRVVKPQPVFSDGFWNLYGAAWSEGVRSVPAVPGHSLASRNPYGQPGDLLWVRETILQDVYSELMPWGEYESSRGGRVEYVADGAKERHLSPSGPWMGKRPSIHMPRRFSRLTLELTGVRVERLQDISEDDAKAEGCVYVEHPPLSVGYYPAYRDLWESINGPKTWDANPFVWVLEFKLHRCNVDQFIKGKEAA